jgi:hypothetical protein
VPELLSEVPQDPFDGQPVRYMLRENGYLLYSIGADGKDDAGQDDGTHRPDVVFRVALPDSPAVEKYEQEDASEGESLAD